MQGFIYNAGCLEVNHRKDLRIQMFTNSITLLFHKDQLHLASLEAQTSNLQSSRRGKPSIEFTELSKWKLPRLLETSSYLDNLWQSKTWNNFERRMSHVNFRHRHDILGIFITLIQRGAYVPNRSSSPSLSNLFPNFSTVPAYCQVVSKEWRNNFVKALNLAWKYTYPNQM